MRLGEWVWSAILAFLLSTAIAIWLEFYPDLPDWVKIPAVAQVTAAAEQVTAIAGKAAGGLLAWLIFPIQLIKAEVKDVLFVRNVDQKAAAVAKKAAAVAAEQAAVAAEQAAVAERAAAVAAERDTVAERAAAVAAERDAVAAEQAAVTERAAAVDEEQAAVAAERDAVAEQAATIAAEQAAVAERAAAVAEQEAAILEWYEQHKDQLPDLPPPPGIAPSGYNGNRATPE